MCIFVVHYFYIILVNYQMQKFLLLILPFFSFIIASYYDIGDVINYSHQNEPIEICHGEEDIGEIIYLGDNNGGITVLGLASWG